MTVSSTTSRKNYSGDGLTTSFATSPVVFFDTSDLDVYVVTNSTGGSTTLTENTHYTVTGGDGSTGTVNLAGGSSPWGAPASGTTLVIVRDVPATQATDFVQNDASDAETLEDALDRLTMIAQQNANRDDRSLRQPDADSTDIAELPNVVDRASKYLAFDADGDPVATAGTTSDLVASVYIETLLDDADAAAARATLDAMQDVFTTRGDLVRAGASGVAERVALGTSTFVLTSNGTDAAWAQNPWPRSYLAGCTLSNNGSDATNDIDIAAGACRDSTNAFNITVAALTKQLDANWAAGTNQGMRYSGAAIANTTYHIWAVAKADGTQDIYATPNASASTAAGALTLLQAETGGSTYVYARRIGSILRESAAIVAFTQDGDFFQRATAVLDVDATNPGTSAVTRLLSVPLGVSVRAVLNAGYLRGTGGTGLLYLSDLATTDSTPSGSAAPLATFSNDNSTAAGWTGGQAVIRTNTAAQIRSRLGNSPADSVVRIATLGWYDTRGRDA